jgi:adenylate cyclase
MRRLRAALLVLTVALGLSMFLHLVGLLERLESMSLDARYASGIGRRPPGEDIVIAWIDQESIDYMDGQGVSFPWRRDVYEFVLRHLVDSGARAVVFDILFDQRLNAEEDRAFGEALAAAPAAVLAMKFVSFRDGGRDAAETARFATRALDGPRPLPRRDRERGVVLPLDDIEAGAARLGFVNVRPDADKVHRRYDLLRLWTPPDQAEPRAFPSLALAGLLAAGGGLPASTGGTDARILLNFRGPEFTFPHVKFVNILESINRIEAGEPPIYPVDMWRDKIVVVGINAEGYEDVHPTPLSRVFPGPELHATAVDNLARGDWLREPVAAQRELLLAAAAAIAGTGLVFALPGVVAPLLALLVLLALFGTAVMFAWASLIVVPVAAPVVGGGLGAGVSFLWRLAVEGRQRRELKRAFTSYLAPEVLAEVLRHPEAVALGGETREVTLFFSDLAGFTGLAEQIGAEELVRFLNDYFTRMCEPLLAERGVIDKFIGDSIMAMFGAPLPSDDHPVRAVRAALAAAAVGERIAAELRAAGRASIATRIGIHTGPAVVGNMGSAKRFDYTSIGDTVNLASRLEGANKAFGTGCLVSESAWLRAAAEIQGREVGRVAVKGRAEPIRVYTPLALRSDSVGSSPPWLAVHERGLGAVRAGDRGTAQVCFRELAGRPGGDRLAELYLQHLEDPAWDGVFRLDEK